MAQIDRGEVTGTVKDPAGAVIAGAKIVLTNDATGISATTQSTATGTYVFNNLIPGTYSIDAEATGFEHYVVHGLYVHVQQVLTTDIPLATGNVKESVTVTASAPLLQAENGAIGQTITTETVNDLPLATRDWGSLAQLAAGVSTAPPGQPTADSGSTESAYFSVNGVNVWQNDFRLDGINDNIEFYGGNYTGTNAAIVPPPTLFKSSRFKTATSMPSSGIPPAEWSTQQSNQEPTSSMATCGSIFATMRSTRIITSTAASRFPSTARTSLEVPWEDPY